MNVAPGLLRDVGYRAALHILTSRTFRRNDRRLWPHVHVAAGESTSIDFDEILAQGTWSSTEELMLRAAWSLFNQDCDVNLWNLLNRLSDDQAETLIHAIACAAFSRYTPPDGILHENPRHE